MLSNSKNESRKKRHRSIRKRIRARLVHGVRSKVRLRVSVAGTNGAATVRVRKISISH